MHVFRHFPHSTAVGALWQHCERTLEATDAASPAESFSLLQAFSRLECALADLCCPEEDEWVPQIFPFQEMSLLAARESLQPGQGPWRRELRSRMNSLQALLPPFRQTVALSTWEGLRYYALFPARYTGAADGWRQDHPQRPAWVIGLRSMGSILAPVVAARLLQAGVTARVCTLRPRGQPHQRHCRVGPRLRQALQEWSGDYLLVDEGPGLSGSSLGSAALLLESLGIASSRIALMPSWEASPESFQHAPSAAVWQRLARYPATPLVPPEPVLADLSAGRWRTFFPGQRKTVSWPQQERVKYLSSANEVMKFAGLGEAAESAAERARELAAAGFAPAVMGAGAGWIRYRVTPAEPLRLQPSLVTDWCETAGNYLAFLASRFRVGGRRPPHAPLMEMAAVNLHELQAAAQLPEAPEGVPVALDARMMPQEWGWAQGRWIKFDGVDHCDDPFFPGPCDIAWDLASVEVEYGRVAGAAVLSVYRRRSGDLQIHLRLPWYRLAYTAFRTAFCQLAATRSDEPDASRWRMLAARYERMVQYQSSSIRTGSLRRGLSGQA